MTSRSSSQHFRDLVSPHIDAAYTLTRYLVRDAAMAEDIVQDSILLASRSSSECCRGDTQVWLLTFVRNGAIDRLAEADNDVAEQELRQWDSGIASGADQPRRAVEALPIPYREVVVLRDIYGLRYQTIADITQASVDTVAIRVACARQLLADWLQEVSSAGTSNVL